MQSILEKEYFLSFQAIGIDDIVRLSARAEFLETDCQPLALTP
jgi:hypothetical protein